MSMMRTAAALSAITLLGLASACGGESGLGREEDSGRIGSRAGTPVSSRATPPIDRSTSCEFENSAEIVSDAAAQVFTELGSGTAFYVGDSEWVTAAHVVEGFDEVVLESGSVRVNAEVIGLDFGRDVALLRGDAARRALHWGSFDSVARGQDVGVIGFPFNLVGPATFTRGSVSRTFVDALGVAYLQTDAPVNPGNSGGPVFDECGLVVGMVVSSVLSADGLSFAIAEAAAQDAIRLARRNPPSSECYEQQLEVRAGTAIFVPLGRMSTEQLLSLSYTVSQDGSGTLDIDLSVVNASGAIAVSEGRVRAGRFDHRLPEAGDHFVRLDNGYSIFTPKVVAVNWCTYR